MILTDGSWYLSVLLHNETIFNQPTTKTRHAIRDSELRAWNVGYGRDHSERTGDDKAIVRTKA